MIAQLEGQLARPDIRIHTKIYPYFMKELVTARTLSARRMERKNRHIEAIDELSKLTAGIEGASE